MNTYRFWTDAMLRQVYFQNLGKLQTMRKLAERGYDVGERFEALETENMEIKQEQDRRAALEEA